MSSIINKNWYLMDFDRNIYFLRRGLNSIGRAFNNDISMASRLVQDFHCEIYLTEDIPFVRKIRRGNQVLVNQHELNTECYQLRHGDLLVLGVDLGNWNWNSTLQIFNLEKMYVSATIDLTN